MARARTDLVPEIQLTQSTPEVTLPIPGKTETITRQIQRVIVEVPLCTNPPAKPGSAPYIALHLYKPRSPHGRETIGKLLEGLRQTEAKMSNGRYVKTRNDAVVWLVDQIGEALNT